VIRQNDEWVWRWDAKARSPSPHLSCCKVGGSSALPEPFCGSGVDGGVVGSHLGCEWVGLGKYMSLCPWPYQSAHVVPPYGLGGSHLVGLAGGAAFLLWLPACTPPQ
jgi:hypothetical protein